MDLFRYKSIECITDSTFQCKGYEAQRVIRLHISFEHFEPKSPGKKIFTGLLEPGGTGEIPPLTPTRFPGFPDIPMDLIFSTIYKRRRNFFPDF